VYNYDNLALEVRLRRAEMLKQAEQRHLATITQGGTRRFRFIGWRLPALHLGLFNRKPASTRTTTRRTVSDNI
jgi:hypothetical protein